MNWRRDGSGKRHSTQGNGFGTQAEVWKATASSGNELPGRNGVWWVGEGTVKIGIGKSKGVRVLRVVVILRVLDYEPNGPAGFSPGLFLYREGR